MARRVNKDLVIHLDVDGKIGESIETPDIILKDYYSDNFGKLIGLAEDGQYYPYLPQKGKIVLLTPNMEDRVFSYQALGVNDGILTPLPPLTNPAVATLSNVALGILAAGGIAAAASGGGGGNAPTTSTILTADTTPPTAIIAMGDSALKIGETSTVTITFSEAVTRFNNSDVTVENGRLSTLTSNDGGITWSGIFSPYGRYIKCYLFS